MEDFPSPVTRSKAIWMAQELFRLSGPESLSTLFIDKRVIVLYSPYFGPVFVGYSDDFGNTRVHVLSGLIKTEGEQNGTTLN